MKVSIIGGGGLVGSCAAFALQCGGLAKEIALLDVNQELAVGHALDLQHGGPSIADQVIRGGGYEHIADSDVICITAGLRRKPDESRLDLINRNTDLFLQILGDVKAAGPKSSAIVLVVSNPVDILTYVAAKKLGLPCSQVIGLGTQLDTIRFCSLIAEQLGAPPTQTKALILGEHGDSMVPIWSSAAIAGLPLDKYPGWNRIARQSALHPDPRKRRRGDQAQGWGWLCRRDRDSRCDRSHHPGSALCLAGQQCAIRLLRHPRCRAVGAHDRWTYGRGRSHGNRSVAEGNARHASQRSRTAKNPRRGPATYRLAGH